MLYKKNKLFLLFFTTFCLQHSLKSMFGRYGAYIAKNLPHVTALLKNRLTKATPTVPAGHVIYNTDGSTVTENQFNEIKDEILRPNEFPTALKNPNYNPDADETKVIQEKLDEKYERNMSRKHFVDPFSEHELIESNRTSVKWIPQTLHDLFVYKYSKNEYDEHIVNQVISDSLHRNPKKIGESYVAYYQRLAEPLINPLYNDMSKEINETNKKITVHKAIKDTIAIEAEQHEKNSTKILLYRGKGSENDFNVKDCYDVGKKGSQADYCLAMQYDSKDNPIALSYGASLLSNSKHYISGECPFDYAFFRNHQDLKIMPVNKKEFFKKEDRLWYINPDYDYFDSVHAYGTRFHPRAIAHLEEDKSFIGNDERIQLHKTDVDTKNAYKRLKKYQVQNAIGVTDYTKNKIKNAQDALEKGEHDRKLTSWMGYMYSFLGYKNK